MRCLHSNYAHEAFALVPCVEEARAKMVAAFEEADTKGAGDCFTEGNGAAKWDEIYAFALPYSSL